MTREETVKWLESLKHDIGGAQYIDLWHYEQAIDMAIEALKAQEWTPCNKKLPEEKTKVLICVGCEIQVAEIIKGITEETREKMKRGEIEDPDVKGWNSADGWTTFKRSRAYEPGDVHGNNLLPYAWDGDGPAQWFGQDADAWMPLPKPYREDGKE